jgi:hypothetical protein
MRPPLSPLIGSPEQLATAAALSPALWVPTERVPSARTGGHRR